MKQILQKPNESRLDYLKKARNWCRRKFCDLKGNPDFKWCHDSFAVAEAMQLTEQQYADLGTFGTEGDCEMNGEGCIDIQYLNAGDSYELTIVYRNGRFRVCCIGDIYENL